ncbi:hypothetical protein RIF29_35150 [Crotalaria pallida]|uniref:Uncharacterized protein n=1 Tax=Crotalaria pallida TaxID=3830 RepID=A0AAN9E9V9_CROPI
MFSELNRISDSQISRSYVSEFMVALGRHIRIGQNVMCFVDMLEHDRLKQVVGVYTEMCAKKLVQIQ